MENIKQNAMQPIRPAPAASTAGSVLLYTAKVVGRPDTGSYPAPSPVPDLKILLFFNQLKPRKLKYFLTFTFVTDK